MLKQSSFVVLNIDVLCQKKTNINEKFKDVKETDMDSIQYLY